MPRTAILMRDHALNHEDYVGSLTGLRGFAALWVFLYHAWVYSEPRLMLLQWGDFSIDLTILFSMGWAGVDFFFVLSAFLLSLPFAHWACGERPFPSVGPYLARRFKRIFPAYWGQLLILLPVAFFSSLYAFPSLTSLISHFFMYLNLPPLWVSPLNGVWWTLPTEFLFYVLLLPLSLLLKTRATRAVLVSLIGLVWFYRWWVFGQFQDQGIGKLVTLMGNTLGYLDIFIIGTLCAYLYVLNRKKEGLKLPPVVFFILGILGILLCLNSIHWLYDLYWDGHVLLFLKNTLMGVSIASILIAILSGSVVANGLLGNRFMMHCGIISYSIYLWHFPVILMLSKWSFIAEYEGYKLPLLLAFSVPLTWLLAYSSYRWIERPFLRKRA